ncbi:type III-B CRISPR-associated protein Cas10/Cmr2 [Leptolyngbya sp. KIOST-1]|uniref:type III-B CRISPR-associated protein Cas10/Cmr2 n=1 Tax=Leptolyngbya sp. KIOST-1 TaxID=1229172 RepID=UPI00056C582B|nr:type III-B CRISPR-associated protein Cas10/Cmr2 [Leptolyngbya sp. KIOST-1]
MNDLRQQVAGAIAQCLTWNTTLDLEVILTNLQAATANLQTPFDAIQTIADLKRLVQDHPVLWNQKIGLVYGGATKIKQYVFESADLQEIRGASALLDRINLIDLPAFFGREQDGDRFPQCQQAASYCERVRSEWLQQHFPKLVGALTPEMVIYSTGGNILAFCPAELVDDLADAIEKRYTVETLTANACAVGDSFYPLEIYLGLLKDPIGNTFWLDAVQANRDNFAVQAYFGFEQSADTQAVAAAFRQRKGFSELVGKLANQFNQRRSGYDTPGSSRPSRRYPPMFETHPYVMRDDSDRRSAVVRVEAAHLPDAPKFSEPTARKRRVGQLTKREETERQQWYTNYGFNQYWDATTADDSLGSWVEKFEQFLRDSQLVEQYDPRLELLDSAGQPRERHRREARSLTEIGAASDGFVAYIYADGNNMGAYIRDQIKTPEHYQQFSQDVFEATEQSVYWALAHLHPYHYTPDAKSSRNNKSPVWIHPFEIITIGGDDVLLVVPANTALEVAKAIGDKFEKILAQTGRYDLAPDATKDPTACHRYSSSTASPSKSQLSISSGVLITAANTPIYYADKLVSQLLKSAKKKAKTLKGKGYSGGTVDFLTLKAVTMISSNIDAFRQEGLTARFRQDQEQPQREQWLKLYAAPYTLHELGGLIETVRAVKRAKFPRSQLYQIRSLLERGRRTAILNYRYFRIRLSQDNQRPLIEDFEEAWCEAATNNGNLAPWLPPIRTENRTIYETLWRELVELYPFIVLPEGDEPAPERLPEMPQSASTGEAAR